MFFFSICSEQEIKESKNGGRGRRAPLEKKTNAHSMPLGFAKPESLKINSEL
jgi:hypothetical protein